MINELEKGLIFDVATARKVISGEKTQTRRIIKPVPFKLEEGKVFAEVPRSQPTAEEEEAQASLPYQGPFFQVSPRFAVGDTIWMREAWTVGKEGENGSFEIYSGEPTEELLSQGWKVLYAADFPCGEESPGFKWRPAIHMPRWAGRVRLKVCEIKPQRLQEITEGEAQAEGVLPYEDSYVSAFAFFWDSLNKDSVFGWDKNPYVWAIQFEVLKEAPL